MNRTANLCTHCLSGPTESHARNCPVTLAIGSAPIEEFYRIAETTQQIEARYRIEKAEHDAQAAEEHF